MFKVKNILDIPDDWKSHRILVWIYWFSHWFFVNFEGLRHRCWSLNFLVHDLEKPVRISIFNWDYKDVKADHRNRLHHPSKNKIDSMKESDWCEALSDWEAAYWTKSDSPLNAKDTYLAYYGWAKDYIEPLLKKYKFA